MQEIMLKGLMQSYEAVKKVQYQVGLKVVITVTSLKAWPKRSNSSKTA